MPKCPPFITNSILKVLNNYLYPIPSKFLSLSMNSNFSALAIPSTKTIETEPQHRNASDRENDIEHDRPISDKIFKSGPKMGKLEKAISLLDRMVSSKCVPNVVTYGTIINGLVKQGRALDGARVLALMEERGYRVNDSLMKGFFEAGNGHKAIEVWKDMAKHNFTQNESSISRAIDLLNSMLDRGCDPDLVTCIIFLRTLREKLDPPQDGREFLDGLVVRLLKRQRVLGASKIVEVMLQKLLPPKPSTWARVVEDLCKPKKVQAAIQKCWSILYC
ncbi:hypothetical protein D5086_007209 [Populus alba]|uniref:Uncharacterized protein n=1 Tax=Populus alba TaxID=43335 RepID=A0ACC4CN63_POPAL